MKFENDTHLVRYWNSKTNPSGRIKCNGPDSSDDLIEISWSKIYPLNYTNNKTQECNKDKDIIIEDLYKDIKQVMGDDDELVRVTFLKKFSTDQSQIRALVDITECLPISNDTEDNYKEIQLDEDGGFNKVATLKLGTIFSELNPKTQSKLLVNSRGVQSPHNDYKEIVLYVEPIGMKTHWMYYVIIPFVLLLVLLAINIFICRCRRTHKIELNV
jgi:hypothetical protein